MTLFFRGPAAPAAPELVRDVRGFATVVVAPTLRWRRRWTSLAVLAAVAGTAAEIAAHLLGAASALASTVSLTLLWAGAGVTAAAAGLQRARARPHGRRSLHLVGVLLSCPPRAGTLVMLSSAPAFALSVTFSGLLAGALACGLLAVAITDLALLPTLWRRAARVPGGIDRAG